MHLQDPNWCFLDVFRGLPRLRPAVMGSFLNVSSFVERADATGRTNCPKVGRRYMFGTEAENVGSYF